MPYQDTGHEGRPIRNDDPFSDLLWEESLQANQRQKNRDRQVNLSSQIEDYLRQSE